MLQHQRDGLVTPVVKEERVVHAREDFDPDASLAQLTVCRLLHGSTEFASCATLKDPGFVLVADDEDIGSGIAIWRNVSAGG